MKRKILLSAYACEPGVGSESAVGWHTATELSKYHEVWVITRENNRNVIEDVLRQRNVGQLNFIYYDLPRWVRFFKKGNRGVHLYYFLWQVAIYFIAKKYHKQIIFDVIHHVSFVMYWIPSFLVFLPVPFIFGPVGGGEKMASALSQQLNYKDHLHELLRSYIKWSFERCILLPWVIKKSRLVLACNSDTKKRLEWLGAKNVQVLSQVALTQYELNYLKKNSVKKNLEFCFVSAGTLSHVKGIDIGLKAFAKANIKNSQYWVIGNGPHLHKLEKLAQQLGIQNQVHFMGKLTRLATMDKFKLAHVLIYPSLHDSGGFVCAEAMAAGCPVICLDVGGPPEIVAESGRVIPCKKLYEVVLAMSLEMVLFAKNKNKYDYLSKLSVTRIEKYYCVERRGQIYLDLYENTIATQTI